MKLEFFLARRFLSGQRFGVFRAVTTGIAIGGTALGVAALLITLAVMDGFRTDIQEKILGTQPQVVAMSPVGRFIPLDPKIQQALEAVPHVRAVAPYLAGQALIQSGNSVTGIIVRGILPTEESKVIGLSSILRSGNWTQLEPKGAVLGQELIHTLAARVGDSITLIAPQEQWNGGWSQVPRMRRFQIVGEFRSGMYEYDANMVYVSLAGAQDLLGIGAQISGYGLRLDSLDRTTTVTRDIAQHIEGLWPRSWEDFNRNLFSAMKLERTVMFIILTLIILVSSFTIISNLLLLTIEKAGEIGILQALGASPKQIRRIFFLNGLILGGGGVSLGLLLGVGISAFLKRFPIIRLPADVYYIDKLPIHLSAATIASVAGAAFALVLISILYPARKAALMDPVQAIRYG